MTYWYGKGLSRGIESDEGSMLPTTLRNIRNLTLQTIENQLSGKPFKVITLRKTRPLDGDT